MVYRNENAMTRHYLQRSKIDVQDVHHADRTRGGRQPLASVFRRIARQLGVGACDTTEVTLDLEERKVEIPDDLTAELDEHPKARSAFAALSYGIRRPSATP